MKVQKTLFGTHDTDVPVYLYRIENEKGAYVEVTNYGCRIRAIVVPDKNGKLTDVCLGYDDYAGYVSDTAYQGAAIGRFGNRIGGAAFTLNGETYLLEKNDGANHLHGGRAGFHCQVWDDTSVWESRSSRTDVSSRAGGSIWNGASVWESTSDDCSVAFKLTSPDGDSGYPGALEASITYSFSEDCELDISYKASSDKDTVINLTNHTYFNLDGEGASSVAEHELQVFASAITDANAEFLPTGTMSSVLGTAFDFTEMKPIGIGFKSDDKRLIEAHGYDHNFCLDGDGYRRAAVLHSPKSGIYMSVDTDQPGIQVYTSNMLGSVKGKNGQIAGRHSAVCLETQHYPNSTNIPAFPSVVLKKGDTFTSKTTYSFRI